MPSHASGTTLKTREIELDFLRGLAILSVVDFHSKHGLLFYPFTRLGWQHFGWIGVDIFFVLSGFLVGGLLVKEWQLRGRIDSRQFLIRRVLKIWPQYYAYLLIIILTGHRTIRQLWGNLLNVQNYTGGIPHTWSLAVEEHAYVLLILIFVVAAYRRTRMRNLFILIGTLSVGVIGLTFITAARGGDPFSATHTRIDGIFYGVMLAILYHYAPETFARLQRHVWLWLLLTLTTVVYFRVEPSASWGHPLSIELSNLIGISLLMLLYRHHYPDVQKHTALYRLVARIGVYSYGIYLWHVSTIAFGVAWERHIPQGLHPAWEWVVIPMLGILLGIAFTCLIEFPTIKLRDRFFPRWVDSAVGIPAKVEESILTPNVQEAYRPV
jgi:peptidoglycan/LPS O-acetylase OafA/YrhL